MVQQYVRTASLKAGMNLIVVPKRKPVPYPHLLPPNATRWERAYGAETGRVTAIPVPVEDVWRWDSCPSHILPWLAWALSVDIWDKFWPDTQKRSIIKESFHLHFKKGTLYAIRRYLNYAGANLVQAIVPPDKAYPGKSLTPEERQKWLERFPQIRLFEFLDRGIWTYGAFVSGGAHKIRKTFFGDNNRASYIFPYRTDAETRLGLRAFYWDQGPHPLATGVNLQMRWIPKDRDIMQNILLNYEQGFVPSTEVQAVFLSGDARAFNFHGKMFPLRSEAPARIFSIVRLSDPISTEHGLVYDWALAPKLRPIEIVPEKVAEPGTMRRGIHIFLGMPGTWLNLKTRTRHQIKCFLQGYLPPTTAHLRLFDRLHLHDPRRLPDGRNPAVYLNHVRLGLPAYHAILGTQIRGKRTLWQANQFVYGYTVASDMRPLAIARDAVLRSKSQRDKILMKTTLNKTITTKLGIKTTDGYRSGQTALTL
jgi:hypothetical protein